MGTWFAQWWPLLYAFVGVCYGFLYAMSFPVQRTLWGWLGEFLLSAVMWPVFVGAGLLMRNT